MNKIYALILSVSLLTILFFGCGESTDDANIAPETSESDSAQVQESTDDSLDIESTEQMSRTGGIEPLDTLGIGDPPLPKPKGGGDGGGQSDMIPPGDRPQ